MNRCRRSAFLAMAAVALLGGCGAGPDDGGQAARLAGEDVEVAAAADSARVAAVSAAAELSGSDTAAATDPPQPEARSTEDPAATRPGPAGPAGPAAEPASDEVAERIRSGEQPVPPAQPDDVQEPSTAEILRATSRRYEGVRSMRAEFEQVLHNTLLGSTARSRGMMYQRSPDRFALRFSDPAGDLIVSDGSYFWLYFPSTDPKQVIRTPRGSQGVDLQSQFIGDPVERFSATYHGRESVRGRAAHVLTLTPRRPQGYRTLKVWIDTEDHLVRRFELTEENGVVRRFDLTDLAINPTLPDSHFQFTPPTGAHVIEQG